MPIGRGVNGHLIILWLFLEQVLSFARSLFTSERDFYLVQLLFIE